MPAGSLLRFSGTRAAKQRYLSDLRSIYGTSFPLEDPDYALLSDPEFYAKLERDPVIYSALDFRYKSVIGSTWHMEPPGDVRAEKLAASLMEELISGIRNFQQSRLMVFRSGLLMGRGYGWTKGSRQKVAVLDGKRLQGVWQPRTIHQEDKRRFQYVPVREDVDGVPGKVRVRQKLQFWDLSIGNWVDVTAPQRRALVEFVYNDRADRLGMGQGLGTPLYHWTRQKALAWRDWAQASERWAQGMAVLKLSSTRDGSKTNRELVDDTLDELEEMRSRHSLVIGEDEEFDLIDAPATAMSVSENQIDKIDKDILRLLSGSVRPMGGDTDTGARAQAETEQESSDVIITYDRSQLDEAMTETLVKPVWELNRPVFMQLGLGDARMPRFATTPEKRDDPQKAVTVITQALGGGIPLRKTDVYEALGFQQPADDDEVFEGGAQFGTPGNPMIPIPGE